MFTGYFILFFAGDEAPLELSVPLVTNVSAVHSPSLSPGVVALAPGQVLNGGTFYQALVSVAPRILVTPIFTGGPNFYPASVIPGELTLTPSLYNQVNAFYSAELSLVCRLTTPVVVSNNQFHQAVITPALVALLVELYDNTNTFHHAVIGMLTEHPDFSWVVTAGQFRFAQLTKESYSFVNRATSIKFSHEVRNDR